MNKIHEGKRYHLGEDPYAKGFTPAGLDKAYAGLIMAKRDAHMICECAGIEEIEECYNPGEVMSAQDAADMMGIDTGRLYTEEMIFEAVRVRKYSRTMQTMTALKRAMSRHFADSGITVGEPLIGKPRKTGLFATVTVQLPLSDGQVVSIVFHSPDNNKMKIMPDDEILAFRWLLNKRDITVAVSPEGEGDVSLVEVGKRVAMLAEKNSSRFQKRNQEVLEQKAKLTELDTVLAQEQEANETRVNSANDVAATLAAIDEQIRKAQADLDALKARNAELENELAALQAKQTGNEGKGGAAGGKNGPYTYTVYKRNLDGSLSNKETLGQDELDGWMQQAYGKFANVRVVRDQDQKVIDYTDNGSEFVPVSKQAGPVALSASDKKSIQWDVKSAMEELSADQIRELADGEQAIIDNAEFHKLTPHDIAYKTEYVLQLRAAQAGKESEAPAFSPGVGILRDILDGRYESIDEIDAALDEAAAALEAAGLMEQYDDLLNEAADYLTEKLAEEAANV